MDPYYIQRFAGRNWAWIRLLHVLRQSQRQPSSPIRGGKIGCTGRLVVYHAHRNYPAVDGICHGAHGRISVVHPLACRLRRAVSFGGIMLVARGMASTSHAGAGRASGSKRSQRIATSVLAVCPLVGSTWLPCVCGDARRVLFDGCKTSAMELTALINI